MKFAVVVAALVASFALAVPADAAVKKKRKPVARATVATVQYHSGAHPHDVYVGGEYIGRDPDPGIRAFMIRNPHIWDGPN